MNLAQGLQQNMNLSRVMIQIGNLSSNYRNSSTGAQEKESGTKHSSLASVRPFPRWTHKLSHHTASNANVMCAVCVTRLVLESLISL